jgi:DNA replication protein DnaC
MKGMKSMEAIIDNLSNNVPKSDNEYVGQDGLTYCKKCGKATQTIVEFMGIEKKVRCICECKKAELEAFERKQKAEEYDRKRRACFAETNMADWTFKKDDRKNPKLSDAMQNYVKHFTEFLAEGKGLLLHGTVGTGKTFLAACIANALIDEGYKVQMTNFTRLTNIIQGTFDGKQAIIDSLNKHHLLIIDDLGAERKSEFMQEQVWNIIDARYRSGLPFIITTNLTMDEIKNPADIGFARIYDRILERCHPVEVAGISRRRLKVKDEYFNVQEKLGL